MHVLIYRCVDDMLIEVLAFNFYWGGEYLQETFGQFKKQAEFRSLVSELVWSPPPRPAGIE